ncbi:MAG: hypothetical protein M1825_000864 [Sarcosagium campestre]|nr:MAG: hypothetical protein M1825_000864 [Sarcosagium campestre]
MGLLQVENRAIIKQGLSPWYILSVLLWFLQLSYGAPTGGGASWLSKWACCGAQTGSRTTIWGISTNFRMDWTHDTPTPAAHKPFPELNMFIDGSASKSSASLLIRSHDYALLVHFVRDLTGVFENSDGSKGHLLMISDVSSLFARGSSIDRPPHHSLPLVSWMGTSQSSVFPLGDTHMTREEIEDSFITALDGNSTAAVAPSAQSDSAGSGAPPRASPGAVSPASSGASSGKSDTTNVNLDAKASGDVNVGGIGGSPISSPSSSGNTTTTSNPNSPPSTGGTPLDVLRDSGLISVVSEDDDLLSSTDPTLAAALQAKSDYILGERNLVQCGHGSNGFMLRMLDPAHALLQRDHVPLANPDHAPRSRFESSDTYDSFALRYSKHPIRAVVHTNIQTGATEVRWQNPTPGLRVPTKVLREQFYSQFSLRRPTAGNYKHLEENVDFDAVLLEEALDTFKEVPVSGYVGYHSLTDVF